MSNRREQLATHFTKIELSKWFLQTYPREMGPLYQRFKACHASKGRDFILRKMLELMLEFAPSREMEEERLQLAQKVFDYFRYTYDPENGNSWQFLDDEGLGLRVMLSGQELNEEQFLSLITAFTQQGKTFVMIALMAIHLALGHIPLIVVKSITDADQLISRLKIVFADLCIFLESKGGVEKELLEHFQDYCYHDSRDTAFSKQKFHDNLNAILIGNRTAPIIAIHHEEHLKRILNIHQIVGKKVKIALFIDEAHELGGYKQIGQIGDGTDLHDPNCAYDVLISKFKEPTNTFKTYLISATTQDILYNEPRLYGKSVCRIPHRKGYVGIPEMRFIIEQLGDTIKTDVHGHIVNIHTGWFEIMNYLSELEPIKRINKFDIEDEHPIILLSMIERENDRQRMILESCKQGTVPVNEQHRKIIDTNWVVMCKNQEGTRLSHESLRGKTITINNQTLSDPLHTGEFLFRASIELVLQWLYMNGGSEIYSHIMIIAYNKAQASTTFCSAVTYNPETDANWHPTHLELLNISKNIPTSKLEQRFGRGTGNNQDNLRDGGKFRTTAFCSEEMKKKILLGFILNVRTSHAVIERCREGNFKVMDFVRDNIELYPNHIPNNPFTIKDLKKCITRKQGRNKSAELERFALKHSKNGAGPICVLASELHDVFGWKPESVQKIKELFIRDLKDSKGIQQGINAPKISQEIASRGLIYTLQVENLTEADARIWSDTVDMIVTSDVWIRRSVIVNNLVSAGKYISSSIRARLTTLQQSVPGKQEIGQGLNFRKIGESEDLELLYHP